MDNLILVTKDNEVLAIHPSTLEAHKRAGWKPVEEVLTAAVAKKAEEKAKNQAKAPTKAPTKATITKKGDKTVKVENPPTDANNPATEP
jgi:predicted secreted Zn-dependent protease